MVKGQIDTPDIVALVALPMFAGIELGVWSLELSVFSGFSFSQSLATIGGTDITLSLVASLLAIAALAVQGTVSRDSFGDEEWYVIAGSMAVIPAHAFVPIVQEVVAMADIIPLILWLALSGAAVYISYEG